MSRTKNRRVKRSVVVALTSVLAMGCIVAIGLGGIQGVGNTGPMIKGTVKWFNDAYLNAVNALLSGTGLTIDRYEGPRLDTIGIRIEPPLGVRVTDNNSPPRTATKKIVGLFETTVAVWDGDGQAPWAVFGASNIGAVAKTSPPYDWGLSLFSLPPGGLLVQFSSEYYQLTAEGSGPLALGPSPTAAPPVPGGPGVLTRRREIDHVGYYSLIPVADQLLSGGPNQQATKKITGVRIDAEVARLDAGEEYIQLSVAVKPPQADKATPCKHHDIQGTKIDLVAARDGDPWGTLDCLWPDATVAGWPSKEPAYMLEIHALPAAGVPITYGGQAYLLGATTDGGLTLTAD